MWIYQKSSSKHELTQSQPYFYSSMSLFLNVHFFPKLSRPLWLKGSYSIYSSRIKAVRPLIKLLLLSMYFMISRGCTEKKFPSPKLVHNFSFDHADILATKPTHEMIIFTKFHKDRRKIVDFLLIANFGLGNFFSVHPLITLF